MTAIKSWIGGLVAGLAIYVVHLIFWATPLSLLAYGRVGEQANADVQRALAAALTEAGTGAYRIPDPSLGGASVLFTRGPVSTVLFNTGGFPVQDVSALIGGLVLAVVVGLLLAEGLRLAADWVPDAATRLRLLLAMVLAPLLWVHLGGPILEHTPWGFALFSLVADLAALFAGGWIVLRWFLGDSRLERGLKAGEAAEREQAVEERRRADAAKADEPPPL